MKNWVQERQQKLRRRKKLRSQAYDDYKSSLARIDLHVEPQQIEEDIVRARRSASTHLKGSHRRKLERECAATWLNHAISDPGHIDGAGLEALQELLRVLHGPGLETDSTYERVMIARLGFGMWPIPRNRGSLLLDSGEEMLLVETVSEEVERYETNPQTNQMQRVHGLRNFEIEVTTERMAIVNDAVLTVGLEEVAAVNRRSNWISLTVRDADGVFSFQTNVPKLIQETIAHARYNRIA